MKTKIKAPRLECSVVKARGYEHALKMAQYLGKEITSAFIGMDGQPQYLTAIECEGLYWTGKVLFRTVNGWSEERWSDITFIKPVK